MTKYKMMPDSGPQGFAKAFYEANRTITQYPVSFVEDYSDYKPNPWVDADEIAFCRKWSGKTMTLQDAADNIKEFGRIIFDGETIKIYNTYND